MRVRIAPAVAGLAMSLLAAPALADKAMQSVQLGPRPFYLVENMDKSDLKAALQACAGTAPAAADAGGEGGGADRAFAPSDFSIGHRGAPLQFPEHTRESYEAAARMGAGIVECDVTFTKDRELVCRHAQCDLHTTTNILAVPELAAKCTEPFTPADPAAGREASAKCCTSDLTLAEFKHARGQDGRVRSGCDHGRGLHGGDGALAHRPVRAGHADDPCREHRAVQESRAGNSRPSSRRPRSRCRSRATTPRRTTPSS